jgi:hypothetical protein
MHTRFTPLIFFDFSAATNIGKYIVVIFESLKSIRLKLMDKKVEYMASGHTFIDA